MNPAGREKKKKLPRKTRWEKRKRESATRKELMRNHKRVRIRRELIKITERLREEGR
jgi:hypothetical protein